MQLSTTTTDEARAMLTVALSEVPSLSAQGLTTWQGTPPDAINLEHVRICADFANGFLRPRGTMNRSRTSYGWKHEVEKWAHNRFDYPTRGYVTNGAFIATVLAMGFQWRPLHGDQSPNIVFNWSKQLADRAYRTLQLFDPEGPVQRAVNKAKRIIDEATVEKKAKK